ncbi:Nuclear protein (Sgd1) [Rasamsonia emersonii CBS 393.64]|uniref:Nuclear protein (Sgd1) n=1 Tax=Rasamsonia emersonii (strain ATCC 16479 / CBS 393.64 / IMI 116815) TaxID=1408163 RepID=A0A0F4YMM9_RASE3|nr:Nuclear protein (Sgd1) [Rasamsonia emersonii CBS 393.64]KKA19489.1 Nuclear protein (Sgd1) [Rasamsonia emersonii CBS 393.64]
MPPRPRSNGPTLPKQLREELGLTDIYGAKKMKQNGPASRKERRKAERREKKAARRPINNRSSREDDDDDDDDDDDIEEQIDSDISSDEEESESTKTTKKPKSILKKPKPTAADEGSEPKPARQIPKSVQEKLAEDDAEIAALERKLGIRGRKKLPKIFEKEGLAELLGDLDADSEEESRKRKRENDEWLQRKRRKAQGLPSEDEEESEEELGSEDDILDESEGDDMDDIDEDLDVDVDGEDDEFAGFDDEDEGDEEEEVDEEEEGEEEEDEDEDEEKQEKKSPPKKSPRESLRSSRGLLNKLSESNLISILGEVEKLYREYPRQSVTSTLTTLLLGLICDRTALQDTFIILHAGFIAAIYKIIGMDFGAEFIQRLVETFDKNGDERGSFEGKEPINLMSLLSQLYNLHVIGSNLVFDYIRLFLQEITETNTEYLLKIIRNSGPQLRQDDPSALKDIVLLIQPAVARVGEEALSVRTKFMIETITDLKNNRMKTGVAASSLASEHLTKMRKILGSLNNRNVRATEPIRISRSDIHNAEKKGKWWLVGASWKDDPLEAARQELSAAGLPSAPVAAPTIEDSDGEPDLVNIAKAHRMNTDVRRAIFVAIMSATDYRDAHVRLLKLHLKRNQEYEIPRVLVHCAMEEDAYNPYYTLIARRVCSEGGRRLRKSFEFTLWDVFKRMGERGDLDDDDDSDAFNGFDEDDEDGNNQKLTTKSIVNLAKMYASLVADGTLTLSILKNLNFAYLQPKTSTFIEVLIITIFQQTQAKGKSKQKKKEKKKKKEKEENTDDEDRDEKPIARIFDRTHDAAPQIVKGLIYFLRKVVAKTDIVSSAKDRKLVKWGCRVALDALRDGSA